MIITDFNKVMIEYLLDCPTIQSNPIFFNFGNAQDGANQIVTLSNMTSSNKSFIDGTVKKQYKFVIVTNKNVSFNPIVKESGYPDENLEAIAAFQEVIEWLKDKIADRDLPDFGQEYLVDSMTLGSENPVIYDTDETVSPPIVKYAVTIQVDYLDTTKSSWNRPILSV